MFQHEHSLTGFMVWVGKPGSITPTHYDQQHVFLSQVKGYLFLLYKCLVYNNPDRKKKLLLFDPSQFCNLYPYPAHHAFDRQSQVNIHKSLKCA